jgi:hypothetical protein
MVLLLSVATWSHAQDMNPLVLTEDAKYFNFWEGTWYGINDNNSIDTTLRFQVKRSVHPASFLEEWKMGNGKSFALRSWDKTNGKWGFVWISENGLYQVWDSKLYDGHWYIVREFDINGDKYLSRQGFLLQKDGTVLRVSEKSYDDKKWEVRFKQRLKKSTP